MNRGQNKTKQRESLFVHWIKPDYGEVTIAGQVIPYTHLMAYQPTDRQGVVDPMHIFLLDAHLDLSEGTPFLLEYDPASGEPLALYLSQEDRAPLWEKPANIEPWIGIYEDALTAKGPSDRVGARIIAISNWPEDDWYHLYVPPSLTSAVNALLQEWNPKKIKQRRTTFRDYDVLYVNVETNEVPPFRSLLEDSLLNAVYLQDWR